MPVFISTARLGRAGTEAAESAVQSSEPYDPETVNGFCFGGDTGQAGQILIPAKLRKSAGLEKDLVFVGMINRVEIWDKDTFEAQTLGSEMSMEEAMDALGISL